MPREEEFDPEIVETGRMLREQVFAANRDKHAAAGYRLLMLHTSGITTDHWFQGLERSMNFAGVSCRVLPHDAPRARITKEFEEFQPNVFLALESPQVLRTLDLPFILNYKRSRGCLRLFIPVWREKAPGGYPTAGEDAWRRSLRCDGLSVDAYYSIFEPEFHDLFSHDPGGPRVECLGVAQACDPFMDYPLPANKRHDYFMATSLTEERLDVSYRYLRPILAEYRGLWAGPRWGFGLSHIPPADMPRHYAQTRIALSPLVKVVHRYGAELTHRVFAAAGCGTFQLTMPTTITHRYFQPDELIQAETPAEYQRMFRHYVDRPRERNVVALAALRRVYRDHTCFNRVDKVVAQWNEWRRRGMF